MPTSVRLDPKTEVLVWSLARRTGQSKSQVIRDAIGRVARSTMPTKPPRTAYDAWKDVIGLAHGGPPDLSERTGEKVRALLLAKRRR
jgi:hypothetical protein